MSAEDVRGGAIVPVEAPAPVADGYYDAAGKSPQQIEQDIGKTRAELGQILDALERKLAPRHMLDVGMDMLKDTMSSNTGSKIGDTLRDNPVPLALIGMGVGWMVLSSTGATRRLGDATGDLGGQVSGQASAIGGRVSGTVRGWSDRASGWFGQAKERVTGGGTASESRYSTGAMEEPMASYAYARQKTTPASGAGDGVTAKAQAAAGDAARRAQAAGSAAAQRAGDYAQLAGQQLSTARDRFTDLLEQHPLAVGAVGFLAGALVAFMLPRSRTEEAWVGPTSRELRERTEALGREAVDRAQQAAERAVDAAVDAAREAIHGAEDSVSGKPDDAAGLRRYGSTDPTPAATGPGARI